MATAFSSNEFAPVPNGKPKMSKVEKYGWRIVDAPGRFRMVSKRDLMVDPAYQREQTEDKVRRIAASWSWIACGTIIVAHRNGEWRVMDGSHRVAAAMRRADIDSLPCFVFETESVQEEAKGFLEINTSRKPVAAIDKFRAHLAIGDPTAVAVQELVDSSGYAIAPSPNGGKTITCVRLLSLLMQRTPDALTAVWPVVVEAAAGGHIHERLLDSACYIEWKIARQNLSLTKNPWRSRFVALGSEGVLAAAAKAAAFYSKGGARVWALGVLESMNKGCRVRLSLDGNSPD